MKIIPVFILLLLASYMPTTWAQCATGVDTGGQCIPPDALESQGDHNKPRNQPQQPRAVWADRWGAIAVDPQGSAFGTVIEEESETKAKEAAMSICTKRGGRNCQITLSYYNQCAAVALDEENLASPARAATKEQAEQLASSGFSGSGHITKIVYSECSYAQRVQ